MLDIYIYIVPQCIVHICKQDLASKLPKKVRQIQLVPKDMWNRYVRRRAEIREKRVSGEDGCEAPDPPFFTNDWMTSHPEAELDRLDPKINEAGKCKKI